MCAIVLHSLAVLSLEFLLALALVAFSNVEALAFVLAGVVGAKPHWNLKSDYCTVFRDGVLSQYS